MALLRSLSLDEKTGASLKEEAEEVPQDSSAERSSNKPETLPAAQSEPAAVQEPEQAPEKAPVQEEEDGAYLPSECVKLIQKFLLQSEQHLGVALLHLLSMAGVCRQWRTVASELAPGSGIAFDCFDNQYQGGVQKFRKRTSAEREAAFLGAARLLHGYSDVLLSGEACSDAVVAELAAKNGSSLTRARLHSTSLSDTGLQALVKQTANLQTLEVQGLAKPCAGKFLPLVFESCGKLQALHLSNIAQLSWAPCKAAAVAWPMLPHLTKLTCRGVNLDGDFGVVLCKLPELQELEVDGSARIIRDACLYCPNLVRVSYTVSSRGALDEALNALMNLPRLRQLELVVKNFTLCSEQLRVIGMLPLVELRLDSFIHKQQPTLSRSSYSHVDNEGVKALVDSICNRWCSMGPGDMQPLKLSLCGASALTHDAVSALLRLPILTELDIGGCARIIAMDKMRLVAKVRAGREMLDSGRRPATRTSRFPGLLI